MEVHNLVMYITKKRKTQQKRRFLFIKISLKKPEKLQKKTQKKPSKNTKKPSKKPQKTQKNPQKKPQKTQKKPSKKTQGTFTNVSKTVCNSCVTKQSITLSLVICEKLKL